MSLVITNSGAASIASNYGTLSITKFCLAYVADIQSNSSAAASVTNTTPDGGNAKCDVIYNFSAYNTLNTPSAIYSITNDGGNYRNMLTCGTDTFTGSTSATTGNINQVNTPTLSALSAYISDTTVTEGEKLFDVKSVSPVSTNSGANVLEIQVDTGDIFNGTTGLGNVQYNRICLYNSMVDASGVATGLYSLFAIMDANNTSPDGTTTTYNVLRTDQNTSNTYNIQIDLGSGALYQTSNVIYKNSILDDATQHYIQYLDFNACTADAIMQLQMKCASISYTLSTLSSGTNNSITPNAGRTSVTLSGSSTLYQSFDTNCSVNIPAPGLATEFVLLNANVQLTITAATPCIYNGSTPVSSMTVAPSKPVTRLISDGVYWFVS